MQRNGRTRWLEQVELADAATHYPAQLSGGMQQRVTFARALAIQPDILLLDEPFSSLDDACKQRLLVTLRETVRADDITVVYVTHTLLELQDFATRELTLT